MRALFHEKCTNEPFGHRADKYESPTFANSRRDLEYQYQATSTVIERFADPVRVKLSTVTIPSDTTDHRIYRHSKTHSHGHT